MPKVYLAIGSNVGDRRAHIEEAIKKLGTSIEGVTCAPIYTSKAVGYTQQADFLNTAISGETALTPNELLKFVKATEKAVGRVHRFVWGPREIDIDIIFYGNEIIDSPELQIPHSRFAERDFVLLPIKDLDPELVNPRSGKTIDELYAQLSDDALSVVKTG